MAQKGRVGNPGPLDPLKKPKREVPTKKKKDKPAKRKGKKTQG